MKHYAIKNEKGQYLMMGRGGRFDYTLSMIGVRLFRSSECASREIIDFGGKVVEVEIDEIPDKR